MDEKSHWESIYGNRAAETVSWYAPHLWQSLRFVRAAAPAADAAIIDVGGGESTLVDDLLADGHRKLSVLDLSPTALDVTRRRLGPSAASVTWVAGDVLDTAFDSAAYDLWHDRAVFHFLTTDTQRQRYVAQVLKALKPGGFAIVGTFGPQGPDKCSGLPVARYAPSELHGTFGEPFQLLDSAVEVHTTPWGAPQQFVYCFCRRQAQ
jgi:SAM-dependent methyltransferase